MGMGSSCSACMPRHPRPVPLFNLVLRPRFSGALPSDALVSALPAALRWRRSRTPAFPLDVPSELAPDCSPKVEGGPTHG